MCLSGEWRIATANTIPYKFLGGFFKQNTNLKFFTLSFSGFSTTMSPFIILQGHLASIASSIDRIFLLPSLSAKIK